jgi:hypothetical protein
MEHYAGIDVSLELSSVCVVDAQGKIVKEVKVGREHAAEVWIFELQPDLGFAGGARKTPPQVGPRRGF